MPCRVRPRLAAITFSLVIGAIAPSARAQGETSELPQLYARGMAEFQAGDFAKAAADLEGLLNKTEVTPQLEPVYFTVGSAWFNAGDYKKAAAAFKNYQAKFPNGPHSAEAGFGLAQSSLLAKNFNDAAAQFSALEKDPRLREQALFWMASANRDAGKIDEAIAGLEKLTGAELKTTTSARGAMMLAQLYSKKGDAPRTIVLIQKLHRHIELVENILELNAVTVELGDQLYQKKDFGDALECYHAAYPREQIIRLQTERIAAMQRRIDQNLLVGRADPSQFAGLASENSQIKAELARTQGLLDEFAKLPTITPAIYIRLARCYYEIGRTWESIIVYQEIVDRFGKIAECEPALFGLIIAMADVNQAQKAQARCEEYLRDFKTGPNADTVSYLLGAVALQANDPRTAETYFGRMLEEQPKGNFRDQMRYQLGNAKFMSGKYDEATVEYKKYLNDFPKGENIEDVNYRIALTALFAGKYEDAMNALKTYMQKYPKGVYTSDAKYRLAVCKYAASLYDEVINDCKAWEQEFPSNRELGEVLALQADALAANGKDSDAVDVYIRAVKTATTDEVMNYSLTAASKILQKRGEWSRVSDVYAQFIQDKPDNPAVTTALYWIGKAKAHEGKTDEAKKITADTIKKYIGDPNRDAVELLLTQLAQLCARKQKPAATPAPVADAATTASSPVPASSPASTPTEVAAVSPTPVETGTPAPPAIDPGAELEALLGSSEPEQKGAARGRILFAKAELARLQRKPDQEQENLARIAGLSPDELSPLLLGRAGDYWLGQNQPEKAAPFFQRLLDEFPKSDYVDFAYAGLGEIALRKKDYPLALQFFSEGTDKIAASQKLKDITIGKARTLFAMDKLDEAKKAFEQVAAVREWRGEATAFSVYSLGEIEAKRGKWAEANAYYQRVYVGYQKFQTWVAKAYIRSGESFEKLGKPKEAAATYREMLRNEKLASSAEAAEARKRLEALGVGQQG